MNLNLRKFTDKIIQCEFGFFFLSTDDKKWVFTPSEKPLSENNLEDIIHTLRHLNEQ